MRFNYRVIVYLNLLILFSCKEGDIGQSQDLEETGEMSDFSPTHVQVELLEKQPFSYEVVSNGKLEGKSVAEVRFRNNVRIDEIYVKNGEYVNRGQPLAKLDDYDQNNRLLQAQIGWEDAKISLADYLIGLGHDIQDTTNIPKSILEPAKIRSGFSRAHRDLQQARFELQQTTLRAPVGGVVADIEVKENNYPTSQNIFCRIIDNSAFEINFPIIESEAGLVNAGDQVVIAPYYDKKLEITGTVSAINPVVDENGLIQVTAVVKTPKTKLLEGMNVKVYLKRDLGDKLSVSKEALTLRGEREVVFTYSNDSLALWNYVETGLENSRRKVIESGLKEGDTIIISGNLHLAHESPVIIHQ